VEKKVQPTHQPEGILVEAAKAIGRTAAKVATAVGVAHPPKAKPGKIPKSNKTRLPRKEKKLAAKPTAKATPPPKGKPTARKTAPKPKV